MRWGPEAGPGSAAPCLACGSASAKPHVVTAEKSAGGQHPISFYRCPDCLSILAKEDELSTPDEAEAAHELGWRHYVQLGAGLDAMVRPLERVHVKPAATLLDVGCGMGFTLDYWAHVVGSRATGVEPSGWGLRGAALLGVEIHHALLEDAGLQDQRFDLVVSSEVIEHVPSPPGFVRQLRARLAEGGVVALTTPSAEFIQPGNPEPAVLAALSLGLHRLLFSRAALERVLYGAGFRHVLVQQEAERLVAWASDAPFAPQDEAGIRQRYIGYLVRREAEPGSSLDLQLGLGYRAFKELVNEGRIGEARAVGDRLHRRVLDAYGLDMWDAAAVRARLPPLRTLWDYQEAAPFALGCILFYRAMALRLGAWGGAAPGEAFDLAHEVLAHSLRLTPAYFQEAATLVWQVQAEAILCAAEAGAPDVAGRLDALLAQPGVDGARRARLAQQVLPRLVNNGRLEQARHVVRAAGLADAAFAQPGAAGPLLPTERDALFAMAVLDVQAEGPESAAAAQAGFATVRRGAEAGSGLWLAALRGEVQAVAALGEEGTPHLLRLAEEAAPVLAAGGEGLVLAQAVLGALVNGGHYGPAQAFAGAAGLHDALFARPDGAGPLPDADRDALFCLAVLDVQDALSSNPTASAGARRFARVRAASGPGTGLWWAALRGELQALDQLAAGEQAQRLVESVVREHPALELPADIQARLTPTPGPA